MMQAPGRVVCDPQRSPAFGKARFDRINTRALAPFGAEELRQSAQFDAFLASHPRRDPLDTASRRSRIHCIATASSPRWATRDVLRRQCDLPLYEDRLSRRVICGQAAQNCVQRASADSARAGGWADSKAARHRAQKGRSIMEPFGSRYRDHQPPRGSTPPYRCEQSEARASTESPRDRPLRRPHVGGGGHAVPRALRTAPCRPLPRR